MIIDMLRDVLSPIDGYWWTLSRCKFIVLLDVLQTYIKDLATREEVILWYDKSLITDSPLSTEQYVRAFEVLIGESTRTFVTDRIPEGKKANFDALHRSRLYETLTQLREYDLLIMCYSPNNIRMALEYRTLIASDNQVGALTQVLESSPTSASRTSYIDSCMIAGLKVAVVRIMQQLDVSAPPPSPLVYLWEHEDRVDCFYL